MRIVLLSAAILTLALCGCVNLVQAPQNPDAQIEMHAHGNVPVKVTRSGDPVVDTATLISLSVEDPDVRALVKEKFGKVDNRNFGQYFMSSDFAELAKKQKVETAPVSFVDKLTYESTEAFKPSSIVLTADAPGHLYVKFVDANGHLEMGGQSVNVSGSK